VNLLNVYLNEHTIPVKWVTFQLLFFKLKLFNTIFKDNIREVTFDLKETLAIERKPNAPRLTKIVGQETANYN
jgi:hypothetical protein